MKVYQVKQNDIIRAFDVVRYSIGKSGQVLLADFCTLIKHIVPYKLHWISDAHGNHTKLARSLCDIDSDYVELEQLQGFCIDYRMIQVQDLESF